MSTKRMVFIFGDMALTFTPDDVEAVEREWLAENPGQSLRKMPSDEFADRCMKRLKASARPTRTVLHN